MSVSQEGGNRKELAVTSGLCTAAGSLLAPCVKDFVQRVWFSCVGGTINIIEQGHILETFHLDERELVPSLRWAGQLLQQICSPQGKLNKDRHHIRHPS